MEDQKGIPMSDQRTLFLVNIFIIHTVRFLNKFSAICEQKLADVHRRILRLDATLSLLEAKLKSIDGLEGIGESLALDVLPDLAIPRTPGLTEQTININASRETSGTLSIANSAIEQPPDSAVSSPKTEHQLLPMIKDDPQFSRFFRMLHVGVPEQGVKLQMSIEGYDPSLLDKPDAPLPPS